MSGRPWLNPGPPPGRHLGRLTPKQARRKRLAVVLAGAGAVVGSTALWGAAAGVLVLGMLAGAGACVALVRRVGKPDPWQDVFRKRN